MPLGWLGFEGVTFFEIACNFKQTLVIIIFLLFLRLFCPASFSLTASYIQMKLSMHTHHHVELCFLKFILQKVKGQGHNGRFKFLEGKLVSSIFLKPLEVDLSNFAYLQRFICRIDQGSFRTYPPASSVTVNFPSKMNYP